MSYNTEIINNLLTAVRIHELAKSSLVVVTGRARLGLVIGNIKKRRLVNNCENSSAIY